MKQGAAETPAHRRITQINVTPEVPRDVSGALRICNAGPGQEREDEGLHALEKVMMSF